MKVAGFEFPDDLYYDKTHGWAKADGNTVMQGLTDFGQGIAQEIVFVEIPRIGRDVEQGQTFMSMESGKWVGRVKAVVSGKIVEANEEIEWESTIINESPYDQGWLVKIEAHDLSELDALMKTSDPAFAELIAAEREKYDK